MTHNFCCKILMQTYSNRITTNNIANPWSVDAKYLGPYSTVGNVKQKFILSVKAKVVLSYILKLVTLVKLFQYWINFFLIPASYLYPIYISICILSYHLTPVWSDALSSPFPWIILVACVTNIFISDTYRFLRNCTVRRDLKTKTLRKWIYQFENNYCNKFYDLQNDTIT